MSAHARGCGRWGLCQRLILAQVAILLCLGAVEISFRLVRYDFDGKERALARLPIFYRQPTTPVGEVFYRRPGPARWEGRPLTAFLEQAGAVDQARRDEPTVCITYDEQGFRNPEGMDDWEVVVVGDSFTELGHLAYDDLFTTELGLRLGVRVKNLGVSDTGPLTHVCYLDHYGRGSATKHAVLVFFGGNDLLDLLNEERRRLNATFGRLPPPRGVEHMPKQHSFVRGLIRLALQPEIRVDAHIADFHSREGNVPVTVQIAPPPAGALSAGCRATLARALADWADTARRLGLQPWLAYMPCKLRVLYGHLTFVDTADQRLCEWAPTDLPVFVEELCAQAGVQYVNLTPDLVAETERGVLTYNAVWDTHLNRAGSHCVAGTLAAALAPAIREDCSEEIASSGPGAVDAHTRVTAAH